jgi:major membrane immunogen (membrane-anchored lipoprotein)
MLVRIIVPVIAALIALSACSQSRSNTNTAASQNNGTKLQTTKTIDARTVRDEQQITAPEGSHGDGQLNNYQQRYSSTDNYDDGANRRVRVRAPFVHLNIDRDTGSLHLHTPFVHVDKSGRGQSTDVDIPSTQVN